MAAIFIIAGGIVGFASAVASLILLDATLLVALAIWSGTGFVALGLGLTVALAPRRAAVTETHERSAA